MNCLWQIIWFETAFRVQGTTYAPLFSHSRLCLLSNGVGGSQWLLVIQREAACHYAFVWDLRSHKVWELSIVDSLWFVCNHGLEKTTQILRRRLWFFFLDFDNFFLSRMRTILVLQTNVTNEPAQKCRHRHRLVNSVIPRITKRFIGCWATSSAACELILVSGWRKRTFIYTLHSRFKLADVDLFCDRCLLKPLQIKWSGDWSNLARCLYPQVRWKDRYFLIFSFIFLKL